MMLMLSKIYTSQEKIKIYLSKGVKMKVLNERAMLSIHLQNSSWPPSELFLVRRSRSTRCPLIINRQSIEFLKLKRTSLTFAFLRRIER